MPLIEGFNHESLKLPTLESFVATGTIVDTIMETEAPAVSEMHRGGAPLELRHCSSADTAGAPAPAAASAYLEETGAANRSHFCLADCCCAQEPPSKDAVSSYDHYWDCCGCPEIEPQGACGPLACCGCGCKLALCAADVACVCFPRAAGACAERVREASDFKRAHQTRAHFDPYPASFGEAKGCAGKLLWTFGTCGNLHYPFGNAGVACCGKICWTEERNS